MLAMQNKPIQVFYRHCFHSIHQLHPSRQRPSWFDKQKVYENFLRTLNLNLVEYTIVYDEFFGPIENTFLKYEKNVEIISGGAEALSFLALINIIQKRNFQSDQIIYLLEDDYIHSEGWAEKILDGFTLPLHYVTLYDPSERYDYNRYPVGGVLRMLLSQSNHHWAVFPNTTNTFAVRYQVFQDDLDIQRKHSTFTDDKRQATAASEDVEKWAELVAKGRLLGCPIPGFSTHAQEGNLSPGTKWADKLV